MWFAFKRVRKIAASHQVCWWQWRLLAEFIGGILNADPKCWRVSCIGFVCVAKSIGVGHITHLHPIATHVIVMEDCLSQDDDPIPYLPPLSLTLSRLISLSQRLADYNGRVAQSSTPRKNQ